MCVLYACRLVDYSLVVRVVVDESGLSCHILHPTVDMGAASTALLHCVAYDSLICLYDNGPVEWVYGRSTVCSQSICTSI
jgi:hypothetical protein